MFAETLAGIALVKSAVDGIKRPYRRRGTSVRLLTSWTSCSPANNRSRRRKTRKQTTPLVSGQ